MTDHKEFAIKYRVIPLMEEKYILVPEELVEGESTDYGFATEQELLPYANEKQDYQNPYVVDRIFAKDELEYIYEYEGEEQFLKDYFFEEQKDTVFFVDTSASDGFMIRNEINLRVIKEQGKDVTYYMDRFIPSIIMNEKALNEISSIKSLKELRLLLEKYKSQLKSFKEMNQKKGITKINVVEGKIDSIEVERNIQKGISEPIKKVSPSTHEISYQGLKKYLQERIFGHEEEIETFAQKLYMNYTAKKGEAIESILFVGPTGTGKTETVRTACEYLDIPSVEANASNIVPQGIKGMSIEDVIQELYEVSGQNLERAQRGLIFLDEFDKLNDSDMELKAPVKNILLTFTSGGIFPIDNDHYHFQFDSSGTTKVYAGVFERIGERKKQLGFNSSPLQDDFLGTEEEIRKKIIEKKYFTLEELSRISSVLGYDDLDRETKKRILMSSKLSEFLKKKNRYKRQFGIDLLVEDSYVDAVLDTIEQSETGMRSVNNIVKRTLNNAEKAILEGEHQGYKQLILTRDTVSNSNQFDLK